LKVGYWRRRIWEVVVVLEEVPVEEVVSGLD
jgi:hypothetical protein